MSFKPLALTNIIKVEAAPTQKTTYSYNKKLMLNVDRDLKPVILGFEILGKTVTFAVEEDTDENSEAIMLKTHTRTFKPEDEENALIQLQTNTKSYNPEDASETE